MISFSKIILYGAVCCATCLGFFVLYCIYQQCIDCFREFGGDVDSTETDIDGDELQDENRRRNILN